MSEYTTQRIELAKSAAIEFCKAAYDRLSAWGAQAAVLLPNAVSGKLDALRARAPLIAAGLVVALALASGVLVLIGPYYTGRAMIQFNFVREEPATGAKVLSTATVDAMAVLDSAAPVIRSPATADAVVTRLGLDKDPKFAHGSLAWKVFSRVRWLLGFEVRMPSNHDLAEQQLMRRITITSDPRSYLISISVDAVDPESAARLANAVALEYLRGQLLQQVTESYAAAEREMSEISSIYGIRHPTYLNKQTKLESLRLRLRELRERDFDEAAASSVAGQSFVAAKNIMVPSGPNVFLVLGLTAGAALGLGILLTFQPWQRRQAHKSSRPGLRP